MSENTQNTAVTETTPSAKKSVKKSAPKKVAAKKTSVKKAAPKKDSAKSPAVKKTEKSAPTADRTMKADVKPFERRLALVKALRKAGAKNIRTAVTVSSLVTSLGYTKFDVYGLLRGTSGKADSNPRCLVAQGLCSVHQGEEGLAAFLTASGAKVKDEAVK